jgi:hypothetical protein
MIQLDFKFQTFSDQVLNLSVKIGNDPSYTTQISGLNPSLGITLDQINNLGSQIPIRIAILNPAADDSDSFEYIEVDGSIIP